MGNLEQFRNKIKDYRRLTGKLQRELANKLGLHPNVLSNKLNQTSHSDLTHPEAKKIIAALVEWGAINQQDEVIELLSLLGLTATAFSLEEWNSFPLKKLETTVAANPSTVPRNFIATLADTPDPAITQGEDEVKLLDESLSPAASPYSQYHHEDWDSAVEVEPFYGHKIELRQLTQWLLADHCRLVALTGAAGIGKTSLALKLAEQLKNHFACVIWRSLRSGLSIEELLADCIQVVEQATSNLPVNLEKRVERLLESLRSSRCLLVFDNFETVLQSGVLAGHYRAGYEGYGTFLQMLGQTSHQSSLILTTREKPNEVVWLAGKVSPVRVLQVKGLSKTECQALLKNQELFGTARDWQELQARYSGNPLILKLASETVRDLFGGDLAAFLSQQAIVFGVIASLLDEQLGNLSFWEKALMYWLAIEREAALLAKLASDLALSLPRRELLEILESLRSRCLIERVGKGASFKLQPVIMEHLTTRLIEEVSFEIISGETKLLVSHALFEAEAEDTIRKQQRRFLLVPLLARLRFNFKSDAEVEAHLLQLLEKVRAQPLARQGYSGGNLINLLYQLGSDLRGRDFSKLNLGQAYLADVELQDANFSGSDLTRAVFSEVLTAVPLSSFSLDVTSPIDSAIEWSERRYQTARSEQIYARMNITGVKGLQEIQKAVLKSLGAIEN